MAPLSKTAKPLDIETGDPFEGDYRPAETREGSGRDVGGLPDVDPGVEGSRSMGRASGETGFTAAGGDEPGNVGAGVKETVLFHPHAAVPNIRLEPLQMDFLMRLADALNTTLDLNTLMHRVADLVRAVIDYRIFAILLLNDRTNELRMRFQTGHTPEIERLRIKLGRGVVGQAAAARESILIRGCAGGGELHRCKSECEESELAVPLIVKNRVVGVIDLQSEHVGYFTEEHSGCWS